MGFQGLPSKKVSINLERQQRRLIQCSNGQINKKHSVNHWHSQYSALTRKRTWKRQGLFTIYFVKWALIAGLNTSSTFPLQIGMVYPSVRSQSTLCRTVMPAKYITLPFSLCFRTLSKFKPQKLVQQALVENGNVGTRKVKPTQKAIKTAAKHIYSKVNGHFQKIFDVSFAEAQTKVSELE